MAYGDLDHWRMNEGVCVGCGENDARVGRRRCTQCAAKLNERERTRRQQRTVTIRKLRLTQAQIAKRLRSKRLSYITVKRATTAAKS